MKKRKKQIKYKQERVVFSDILPYEVPVTFSNRHFYNFLVSNKIKFSNNSILWKKDDIALEEIVKFVFNLESKQVEERNGKKICKLGNGRRPYNSSVLVTIPFNFKISRKQNEFRELTVIHPVNQLVLVEFYNRYKELILYYCNKSPFSIRRPYKIAKFVYCDDISLRKCKKIRNKKDAIDILGKEYENLKTFFSYKDYKNIFRFYESYAYQRNEKKFNFLHKFDISKCFDSIYTHSLSWAIYNKEIVKENIDLSNLTFGGVFDSFMQKLNHNETNGIVIGPEFSRIFAEILLQEIDVSVYRSLKSDNNGNIRNKVDYAIFRYVDDYFLFVNDEKTKERILDTFKYELKKYNLYINESKSFTLNKPIITDLTIAKKRIGDLLNNLVKLKKEDSEDETLHKYSLYFNSKKAVIEIKTIIKETGVSYKDILNYILALIDRKTLRLLKDFDKAEFFNIKYEKKFKEKFVLSIIELLDFIMFLYSVAPQVNTTIRLCAILSKICKFVNRKVEKNTKRKYFSIEQKNEIFKKIFDDISLVLKKNRNEMYKQVETLYLLIALRELGKDYRLDNETLRKYLNLRSLSEGIDEFPYELNFWSITVLLFYIRDLKRYKNIKIELMKNIKLKYKAINMGGISKNAELVILTLDLLSCPYLKDHSNKFKKEILELCGIKENKIKIIEKLEKSKIFFTKWKNFDFERELNTKRSREVY